MKITKSQLRCNIRQILLEQVFGNQAFVYHGSPLPPEQFTEIIETNTFNPGGGAGAMYGKGLYSVYDILQTGTSHGRYGKYIYKLKVNLNGFLIFDTDICEKVHGKPMSLKTQLFDMGLQKVYNTIKKDWPSLSLVPDLKNKADPEMTFEYFFDRDWITLGYTSVLAVAIRDYIMNKVSGIVFTGHNDGKVCLIYDPSVVVVIGYHQLSSRNTTDGKDKMQFNPIQPGKQQIHRSAVTAGDPTRYSPKQKR